MHNLPSYHNYIDNLMNKNHECSGFFDERILEKPLRLSNVERSRRDNAFTVLGEFFTKAREIFHECVLGETDLALKRLLLNDSIDQLPQKFYRDLPKEAWTNPFFFRTDESRAGHVFEIQCPGSGWGDLLLLDSLYKEYCSPDDVPMYNPVTKITEAIQTACGCEYPKVLHLLDNSSNPSSMYYLIRNTQPPLCYWGWMKGIKGIDCNFIRSHSVYGLISENLFKLRLAKVADGKALFDLPPLLIFDQKMASCLPFIDATKAEFSDEIRDLLAYTYPVSPDGFRDYTGEWLSLEQFLSRPPRRRKYYLKYGGTDTSINWGSRGVYRLSEANAKVRLEAAAKDYERGRPWVIQPDWSHKEEIAFIDRDSSEPVHRNFYAKYSTFYGPAGVIGIRTHHRHLNKVHGQPDSVVGLAF